MQYNETPLQAKVLQSKSYSVNVFCCFPSVIKDQCSEMKSVFGPFSFMTVSEVSVDLIIRELRSPIVFLLPVTITRQVPL